MLNLSYLTESENNSTYIFFFCTHHAFLLFIILLLLVLANEYTEETLDFSVSNQASKGYEHLPFSNNPHVHTHTHTHNGSTSCI